MSTFPTLEALGPNATLRPAIGAVNRVTDEAIVELDPSGLTTQAVDAANVAYGDLDLPAANFDIWDTETWTVGLPIDDLNDALGEIGKRDTVRLEADAGTSTLRVIDFEADSEVAELSLLDPEDVRDPPDIPNLDWKTAVEIPGDQFSRLIRVSKDVSAHLSLGIGPDDPNVRNPELVFRTLAEGDVDEVIGYPDFEYVDVGRPGDPLESLYSIDYLNSFRLGVDRPASTDVRFRFAGDDFPLEMSFSVGDGPGADVAYFVAPRIESGRPEGKLSRWAVDSPALDTVDWKADMDGDRGKAMFETFTTYADEYRLLANELGMEMRAVDPSNVAMMGAEISPSYFDSLQEIEGFPQGPIGMSSRGTEDIITKWRQGDDMEFAGNSNTRYVSLKHPIFTARIANVDPDSIREEPTLPELELTAKTEMFADSYRMAAEEALEVTDHVVNLVTDGRVYAIGLGDEQTRAVQVDTVDAEGRALTLTSGDYTQDMLETWPEGGDVTVEMRAGVEFPIVFQTDRDGFRTLYLIAPRIQSDDDSTVLEDVKAALADEPVDLSWIQDLTAGEFDAGNLRVGTFGQFERESITERMRQQRLSTFPIESSIHTTTTGGAHDIAVLTGAEATTVTSSMGSSEAEMSVYVSDAEDMAVPEETIREALNEIVDTLRFDVIDTGERVADVAFEDEQTYTLDLVNIQPEFEYRTATADGIRMAQISNENNNYAYVSQESDTPSRDQVIVRATKDPDGDGYVVYVGLKGRDATAGDVVGTPVSTGHPTIGNAYSELLEYVTENAIEDLIRDAGGEVTLSDREVRDELEAIVDEFVDYRLHGKPGSMTSDVDFYASIIGRQSILPDAAYRADINVMRPETEAEDYLVRYALVLEASGPGDARITRELARNTVGVTERRDDIFPLVREAFDQLEGFGDVYARRERRPAPPRSPAAGPGVRLEPGGTDAWVEFYLPEPREDIIEAMDLHGLVLPLSLTEVDQVGESRAEPLEEAGVVDMLDLVALTGTNKDTGIGQVLIELAEPARENLIDAAETIWEEIIWPRREAPEGFEPPETDISDDVREPEGEESPDIPPEVVEQTREDPAIPIEELRANIRALGLPLEFEDIEEMGPSRIEAFEDVGLRDMADVALVAGFARAPIAVIEAIESLPRDLQRRVDSLAEDIHDEAVLDAAEDGKIPRRRDGPPGPFAFTIPADLRNPSRRIETELRQRNAVNPDSIDRLEIDGEILVTVRGAELAEEEEAEGPVLDATSVLDEAEEREAVFRHIFAGESQADIAADMNVSSSTISKAVQAFKRTTGEEGEDLERSILDEFGDAPGEGEEPEIPDQVGPFEREDTPPGRLRWSTQRGPLAIVVVDQQGPNNMWEVRATVDGDEVENTDSPLTKADAIEFAVEWMEGYEPDEEPDRDSLEDRTPAPWRLEEVTDSRVTWAVDGLTGNPPASVPRDADGTTFLEARQSQTRWHVRFRWEYDGETETSRRNDFTVGDARQKAINRAIELMEEFQPEAEEEPPKIVRVVREEADQWECDPETINSGECDDFATAVDERVEDTRIVHNLEFAAQAAHRDLAPGAEHVWVEHEGRHYDAEAIEGVDDWRDLPFFGRFYPDDLLEDAFVEFGIDSGTVHHPEIYPSEPREPDKPEEPPFIGAVEITPVVQLFGDEREIDFEDIEIDLPESLREEVRQAVREEVDVDRVPLGEPLGTVRLKLDGVEETRLERARELMTTPEETEAQERANEALDILRE